MSSNAEAFAFNLDKHAKGRTPRQFETIKRKLVLDLFRRVIKRNPVRRHKGGRSRGNWQLGVDSVPGAPSSPMPRVRQVGPNVDRLRRQIPAGKPWSDLHLINHLPYIVALERGHSKQAAHGMLRVSLIELAAVYGR